MESLRAEQQVVCRQLNMARQGMEHRMGGMFEVGWRKVICTAGVLS